MRDDLGNRMKEFYENRTMTYLPRRTYTVIRIDGKAFHTFTKRFDRPFDNNLIDFMNYTTLQLCKQIQGCKFGYVQSDEISLVLTDFDRLETSAWFDGNIQKICSVSASIATSEFNKIYMLRLCNFTEDIDTLLNNINVAQFDSRTFSIPYIEEVVNYFIWRQQDCTRNSIQSVAQLLYSQKELQNKKQNELQELIFKKGINWNDYSSDLKCGRGFIYTNGIWSKVDVLPIFSQNRFFIKDLLDVKDKIND